MKMGQQLFVKIQYVIGEKQTIEKSEERLNLTARQGTTKYIMASGMYNRHGGILIFRARDMEEANEIVRDNPMIRNLNRQYKVKYDVSIFLKDIPYGNYSA